MENKMIKNRLAILMLASAASLEVYATPSWHWQFTPASAGVTGTEGTVVLPATITNDSTVENLTFGTAIFGLTGLCWDSTPGNSCGHVNPSFYEVTWTSYAGITLAPRQSVTFDFVSLKPV